MTPFRRLTAAIGRLLHQAFCGHATATATPLVIHPATLGTIYRRDCEECGATWLEWP